MRRRDFCGRRIWPWQRQGWEVAHGVTFWWHGKCWRRFYGPGVG